MMTVRAGTLRTKIKTLSIAYSDDCNSAQAYQYPSCFLSSGADPMLHRLGFEQHLQSPIDRAQRQVRSDERQEIRTKGRGTGTNRRDQPPVSRPAALHRQ